MPSKRPERVSGDGEQAAPPPDMVPVTANLLMFLPERMGWAERFAKFYEPTYRLKDLQKRNVTGVTNHLRKSIVLYGLVQRLRPNLDIDQNELQTRGFTAANNSNEFSAVFESSILELYSAVDCTAQIIIALFKKNARKLGDSTRTLFSEFEKIEGAFPEEVKAILRGIDWFHDLRVVRDEFPQTGR